MDRDIEKHYLGNEINHLNSKIQYCLEGLGHIKGLKPGIQVPIGVWHDAQYPDGISWYFDENNSGKLSYGPYLTDVEKHPKKEVTFDDIKNFCYSYPALVEDFDTKKKRIEELNLVENSTVRHK